MIDDDDWSPADDLWYSGMADTDPIQWPKMVLVAIPDDELDAAAHPEALVESRVSDALAQAQHTIGPVVEVKRYHVRPHYAMVHLYQIMVEPQGALA